MSIVPYLTDAKPFQRKLLRWYGEHARPLPWRHTKNPYAIWVSEVMLQQTRVDNVLSYFPCFMKAFPDMQALASALEGQVLKVWEGLGYYGRARNLHKAAKILCETNGARLPDSEEALRRLPGIGDYIVAAILSFAFGKPVAVLDGNVKRVLARFFAIEQAINDEKAKPLFQQTAQELLPVIDSDLHNQAMMELGALVCTPKHPKCEDCPVAGMCQSHRDECVNRFPIRTIRRNVPTRRIVIGIIVRKNGQFVVVQRPSDGLLGGLWEFPNTEIDETKTFEEGIRTFLDALFPHTRPDPRSMGIVRHAYTHFKVLAEVFWIGTDIPLAPTRETHSYRWLDPETLSDYPLSKITHKAIRLLGKEK